MKHDEPSESPAGDWYENSGRQRSIFSRTGDLVAISGKKNWQQEQLFSPRNYVFHLQLGRPTSFRADDKLFAYELCIMMKMFSRFFLEFEWCGHSVQIRTTQWITLLFPMKFLENLQTHTEIHKKLSRHYNSKHRITPRKSIINIPLNALNMFFWLITASKLLQRKSTLEKTESFLLSNPEIGSPLGLVTSRLLSNVEAAEDWAALVGMWTKVGWIPGRKGYKKEKKRMRLTTNFACSYNKEQLSIPKAVVKEGKTRQFLLPSEERLWKNLGKIKRRRRKDVYYKNTFSCNNLRSSYFESSLSVFLQLQSQQSNLKEIISNGKFFKDRKKSSSSVLICSLFISRHKDKMTLW